MTEAMGRDSESADLTDAPPSAESTADSTSIGNSRSSVVFPRLFVGMVILICAEVFSGASIKVGLWMPWTWLMTYWLYFAHFFFFTTLAVRTGRTSIGALYLWGVLFGLYESWITKVVWHGYGGDGKFVMGNIGPYGFSEVSMVFFFHPLVSFILPLAVACVLCPNLRPLFPDVAWITGSSRGARWLQIYLAVSFAPILAMNSGGPLNLALNLAVALILLFLLARLSRRRLASSAGHQIVVFGRRCFMGLCLYLVVLYGVTYRYIRPDGLPSVPVQLVTFVFYAMAIAGVWLHRPRTSCASTTADVDARELKRTKVVFAWVLGLALALSPLSGNPVLFVPILPNFVIWTLLGFVLTAAALVNGVRERFLRSSGPYPRGSS